MEELENWNEVTKGLYRYVIASNVCYEIHIKYKDKTTSDCSLYIAGDWISNKIGNFFEREVLYEGTLEECIHEAIKDNKKNNI